MKTIVAAVDFSDATPGVLAAAVEFASALGGALHLLHVLEPEPTYTAYGFTPDEFPAIHMFQEEARKRATKRLNDLLGEVGGRLAVTVHLAEGSPLHGVLDYAKHVDADLVVVGSHGHGAMAALLLGSVAEGLVRKATVPTLVVPKREKESRQ